MKVTEFPLHIVVPGDALMEMVGITNGFTVMVILFELATGAEVQAWLLVISQATWSPFTILLSVYVSEFVPTFDPFFFH